MFEIKEETTGGLRISKIYEGDILISMNGESLRQKNAEFVINELTQRNNELIPVTILRGDQFIDREIATGHMDLKIEKVKEAKVDRIHNKFIKKSKLPPHLADIICTTAHSVDGYRVIKTIDVISSECVFGLNIIKETFIRFSDVVGGRSNTTQDVLKEAKETCMRELRQHAYELGADAVIGIDLDYSELSSKNTMVVLVASGTAVQVLI